VRYRLDVVAATVADAVAAAGGWMFDRVMAGWDVRVMLADAGYGCAADPDTPWSARWSTMRRGCADVRLP
jgi:hypothetical protein